MQYVSTSFAILALCLVSASAVASPQRMPKENVVDVPAVGEGLCVHNLFQSNMVLQRDKPIGVWGWADAGEQVVVSFGDKTQTAIADETRAWKVTFPAMPASSVPSTMIVKSAGKVLTLENILLGDVWVLGGQSNMEFPLDRIENGQLEIVSANYKNIRILTVPAQNGPEQKKGFARLHEWSSWFGRHYRKGDWDECSPEIARELSAIGYVFARRIHMATQIPIGVIDASRGGTTVETWIPNSVLREVGTKQVTTLLADWDKKVAEFDSKADLANRVQQYEARVARLKKDSKPIPANLKKPTDLRPGPPLDQNRPGNCYASMIAPIAGIRVKGAIFHQGYNNCFNGTEGAILYRQLFPKMIAAWRTAFGDPKMSFGILSLCTEGTPQTRDNYCELMNNAGPYVREAQYQTFLELYRAGDKNIGFTSTYDLRRRWYHPQLKIPAGERIARWALATQYGFEKSIRWKPPMVSEMKVDDDRIVLHMDEPTSGVDDGGPMEGFAIAGEDRKFHPAKIKHLESGKDNRGRPKKDWKVLVLTSPMVPNPIHYRYAWGRSPMGNIQARHNVDIPMATQRSDDWPLEAVPLGVFGDTVPETLDRRQKRQLTEALRKLDAERKRKEAEVLLNKSQAGGSVKVEDKSGSQRAVAGDLKKLQGTWEIVAGMDGGRVLPVEDRSKLKLVFENDVLTQVGGPRKDSMRFGIDASRSPKHIDFTHDDDSTDLGIYRFVGDKLLLCIPEGRPGERPTAFESKPNSANDVFLTLKKVLASEATIR